MKYKFFNILGIMSGTSADGIDISLVRTNGISIKRFNKNFFKPFPKKLILNSNLLFKIIINLLFYKKYK